MKKHVTTKKRKAISKNLYDIFGDHYPKLRFPKNMQPRKSNRLLAAMYIKNNPELAVQVIRQFLQEGKK